jgi:anti-sigma-K factor RskA
MRCDEMKDLLPLQAAGVLEAQEEAAVRGHLEDGCPHCAAEFAAARETLGFLPFSLPVEEPSPMAKARLMEAVRREAGPARAPWRVSWMGAAATSLAAASAAALLTGTLMVRRHGAETADLRAEIVRQREATAALRRQILEARQSIRLVSSPGVLVVDLAGQGERAGATARVFWDRGGDRWQLYAANLPPPESGKIYQLWLITATAKISAGTFETGTAGEASGSVALPPDAGPVLAAAVTDEPPGGSPQPTGSILLLGKV